MRDEEFNLKVAETLKYFRCQASLSQEKLADLSDLHSTYISLIERNKRKVTLKTLNQICLALNIPLSEFVIHLENS